MVLKDVFEKCYKGKKVFITGHTGFKGSWLLVWLGQLGAVIKGYALSPEHHNGLYSLVDGTNYCESVFADIRDQERLEKEINAFQPDFIFHLAAQPLVRASYKMPLHTYEVNVIGTIHLLEAIRKLEKACVTVVITTDKVYENAETKYAYKETDKLGGYDPYSSSKAAAEIAVSSYRDSFFHTKNYGTHKKAVATARAGNVIGGGDWSDDRIIPDIIRALTAKTSVPVRNPDAVRPWQHVLEPLSGYLLLAARMTQDPEAFSGAWNFGPFNHEVATVREIVEHAIAAWGEGDYSTPDLAEQPHEAGLLMLDISKAMNELKWKPKMNTETAVQKTVTWYKNVTKENAATFSVSQIEEYSNS